MGSLFLRLRKNRFLAVESDEKACALGFRCVVVVLVHRNSAMILNINIYFQTASYYRTLLICSTYLASGRGGRRTHVYVYVFVFVLHA